MVNLITNILLDAKIVMAQNKRLRRMYVNLFTKGQIMSIKSKTNLLPIDIFSLSIQQKDEH